MKAPSSGSRPPDLARPSPDRDRSGRPRRRPACWAALALALASAGLAPGRADAGPGPRRALVMGNDEYPKDIRLNCCVNDAKAIATWLEAEGYRPDEITLLTNARKRDII